MLCERCHKKEATVHYVQIVNGQKTESHLCAACAGRENLMTRAGTFRGMENFMGSVFEDPFFRSVWDHPFERSGRLSCPECGMTLDTFREKGELGCPDCYEAFREQLRPLFEKTQEGTAHRGKNPADKEKPQDSGEPPELKALKEKLNALVTEEKYEEAARVRDQIRDLTEKGKKNDGQ